MDELVGYNVDKATGFLEKKADNSFNAYEKTRFLKAFKLHGDQSKAAGTLGYPFEVVSIHLKHDPAFAKAFRATLLEMRHELEGKMYRAGLQGSSKDAKIWLDAHFPETYKPSAKIAHRKAPGDARIDDLYDKSI